MNTSPDTCPACGHNAFRFDKVLWTTLVQDWQLAPHEVAYVDRQQGFRCRGCKASLRSMGLAAAICRSFGHPGPLSSFAASETGQRLKVLEVNEAGELSQFLSRFGAHTLALYPDIDMTELPYADKSFDLVVHSDTLEHVPRPVVGLGECHRVLRPGGLCAFTIPVIVDRLTRDRAGLPPSYHGDPKQRGGDWVVQTEYGADAWKHVLLAGFAECRISTPEYPSALAFVGVRGRF